MEVYMHLKNKQTNNPPRQANKTTPREAQELTHCCWLGRRAAIIASMLLHHCWRCSAANTSIGTTQTGSVVSKPGPWLSLGRAITYKTIIKALYRMVTSHTRTFPSRVELQHSWESFFYAWACVRVEPQDAERQTLPDWQLKKILCIQVAASRKVGFITKYSPHWEAMAVLKEKQNISKHCRRQQ